MWTRWLIVMSRCSGYLVRNRSPNFGVSGSSPPFVGLYTDVFPSRKRGNAWKLLSAVTLAFIASSIGIATQMLAFVTQCPLIDLFPTDPTTLAYRLAVLHVVSCRINVRSALRVGRPYAYFA